MRNVLIETRMSRSEKYSQFYCEHCDVQLHDDENFKNHLRGKPHLKQMQRIDEDRARRGLSNYGSSNTKTGMSYYELPSQYNERLNQFHNENSIKREDRSRSREPKREYCDRDRRSRDSDYEDKYRRSSRSPESRRRRGRSRNSR